MMRKSAKQFSGKIMLKQHPKALGENRPTHPRGIKADDQRPPAAVSTVPVT